MSGIPLLLHLRQPGLQHANESAWSSPSESRCVHRSPEGRGWCCGRLRLLAVISPTTSERKISFCRGGIDVTSLIDDNKCAMSIIRAFVSHEGSYIPLLLETEPSNDSLPVSATRCSSISSPSYSHKHVPICQLTQLLQADGIIASS